MQKKYKSNLFRTLLILSTSVPIWYPTASWSDPCADISALMFQNLKECWPVGAPVDSYTCASAQMSWSGCSPTPDGQNLMCNWSMPGDPNPSRTAYPWSPAYPWSDYANCPGVSSTLTQSIPMIQADYGANYHTATKNRVAVGTSQATGPQLLPKARPNTPTRKTN
jgi:hypothetical protein